MILRHTLYALVAAMAFAIPATAQAATTCYGFAIGKELSAAEKLAYDACKAREAGKPVSVVATVGDTPEKTVITTPLAVTAEPPIEYKELPARRIGKIVCVQPWIYPDGTVKRVIESCDTPTYTVLDGTRWKYY